MTQEELAGRVGISTASVSQLETGKQGFTDTTLYALARALDAEPGDLLSYPPNFEDDGLVEVVVPVVGYVGAGAEVMPDFEQVPPEGLDQITVPFPMPDDMIAFKVRGDSMLPVFKDGAVIIVYREQKRPLEAFYGEEAAVRTSDGRRFIKTVMRGESNTVNLMSWNASPIEGVRLEWIGEIFTIMPPSAFRKVEKQGGIQGQLKLKSA
jgi:repressor LexA